MSLPVMNFPMLSFEQANPGLTAARSISDTLGQVLANRQAAIQQQYLGPSLQQALQQSQFKTQQAAAEAPYYQPKALADLLQAQAQAPYLQAETQRITQGEIPLEAAQTAEAFAQIPKLQMETQYMPYQMLGQYYGGMGRLGMAQYYNNPQTRLSRVLNSPAMESLVATNPDTARDVGNALANLAHVAGGANAPMNGAQIENPALTSQGGPAAAQSLSSVLGQAQIGQPQQNSLNEEDFNRMRQTLSDSLLRKTTTAQIMNQRQYAGILDNLFDAGSQLMPSVAKYAGALGKAQGKIDAVKSSLGETTPDYSNYLYFTRTLAPNIANEVRRVLGGQATDQESAIVKNVANPDYWDSNPTQAMNQYNYLVNLYKNRVNPALASSPTQTLANITSAGHPALSQQFSQQTQPLQNITQADLEHTAKLHNISVDEVKRRLGVQ